MSVNHEAKHDQTVSQCSFVWMFSTDNRRRSLSLGSKVLFRIVLVVDIFDLIMLSSLQFSILNEISAAVAPFR